MTTKIFAAALCAGFCVFCPGCGKREAAKPPPAQPAPAPVGSTDPSPPAPEQTDATLAPPEPERPPPPPTPTVLARAENTVRQNVVGEVDAELTAELRTFVQQKKRLPVTFAEFAGIRLDTIPRPPAGKKWVIDTENLQVKAVTSQ